MKYNIGMFGTFDVENYGDVFFPVVFQKAMEARELDFNLFAFSPVVSQKSGLLGVDYNVYPVNDLETIHQQYPLDAIVIGGGAIIHYSKVPVKLPEQDAFFDYKILDTWMAPILFALKNNIKILFNAPQVPYPFDDRLFDITKSLIDQIDYLSVRDEVSKSHVMSVYGEKEEPVEIFVTPDTVCCIPQYISEKELKGIRETILPFSSPYAVVHFNAQLPQREIPGLMSVIRYLASTGLKVLLLPLGYTHGDDQMIEQFHRETDGLCERIQKKLTIFEMASILSGCEIYVGASFHGAVTAVSYGRKAVSYNYIHPYKNQEMFKMFGLEEYVTDSSDQLLHVVEKRMADAKKGQVDRVIKRVNEHFDNLYQQITNGCKPSYMKFDSESSLHKLLPEAVKAFEYNKSLQILLQENEQKYIQKLSNLEYDKNKYISLYTSANKHNLELTKQYYAVLNMYNLIASSTWWKITKPGRKLTELVKRFIHRIPFLHLPYMTLISLKNLGYDETVEKIKDYKKEKYYRNPYPPRSILKAQKKTTFARPIKFSIVVPLYNTPQNFLKEMIDSVVDQSYPNWELCMADGSDSQHDYVGQYVAKRQKKDDRIKYRRLASNEGISENTNRCLEMATGDYIGLFDHDDVLHPSALYEYMKVICEKDADFIYCDEDKFETLKGKYYDPHFKPDFAEDNLRSNNYICHFTVFQKELLEQAGTFRKEFDGSQDHDLILRLTEKAKRIVHIPRILYHWRVSSASVASDPYAKPYTIQAGIRAVSEHLERCGLKGTVESTKVHPNIYRVKYELERQPLVSIIIPNYNHIKDLSTCLDSILEKTTYPNYEIIIVENNSDEETFRFYDTLKRYDNIKVVVYHPTSGFNYSAINNYGRSFANGEHLILLNNDIEVITPDWIEEMLMYSQRSDVGAVGAMLYYPNDTIQHAGVIVGVMRVAAHIYRTFPKGSPGYFGRCAYQQNLSAVTAACLMVKSAVYDEVNGLDETFEVAFNDIDFCMRIREKGYKNVWTPFAELYHHESISRGEEDTFEKQQRFQGEVDRFIERWEEPLNQGDPYYNPNLSYDHADFRTNPKKYLG